MGDSFFAGCLEAVNPPERMRTGSIYFVVVKVTRQSQDPWPTDGDFPVRLAYHWLDRDARTVLHDGLRTPLLRDMPRDQPVRMTMQVASPPEVGQFQLRLTLVQEKMAWFEDHGFQALDLAVQVDPSLGEDQPVSPLLLAGRYNLIEGYRRCTRSYWTWPEYLRWATVNHEFHAPFAEPDLHIIATLNSRARDLARRYAARPQTELVSIVMPVYNREKIVRGAIESIVRQTYRNWELIIVDDGSTDASAAVGAAFGDSRITTIRRGMNQGPCEARNAGLERARGSIIAYLDSDNTWLPDYLLVMANALADAPERLSAYCAQRLTHRFPHETVEGVRYGPFNHSLLENVNFIDINAFVHRHSVLDETGGFDNRLPPVEDWGLLLRIASLGTPLAVPAMLSHYLYDTSVVHQGLAVDNRTAVARVHASVMSRPFSLPITGHVAAPPKSVGHQFSPPRHTDVPLESRPSVTIIVPSFEAPEYLDACLDAVAAFTPQHSYELIVVDNASSVDARSAIETSARRPDMRLIGNDRNYGFSYAVNQGILTADPEADIVILNNDALVTPGWLEALQHVATTVSNAGIVVPRQVLLPRTPTMTTHVPAADVDFELDVNLSHHHRNVLNPEIDATGLVELTFAPFFCAYLTRHCIRTVGLLDAEHGRHYGSDRLYCDLARERGLRVIYTPHSKVYHFLQRSTEHLQSAHADDFTEMFVTNTWKIAPPPIGLT